MPGVRMTLRHTRGLAVCQRSDLGRVGDAKDLMTLGTLAQHLTDAAGRFARRGERGGVGALARLISGDHVTELSLANAREMLGWSAGK